MRNYRISKPISLSQIGQNSRLRWSHYLALMSLPNPEERGFYELNPRDMARRAPNSTGNYLLQINQKSIIAQFQKPASSNADIDR